MNKTTTHTEQVQQIMRDVYDALDNTGDVEVNPKLVAARTLDRLDPEGIAPTLVGWTATLELRQMARAFCRRVSCVADLGASVQSEMFDGQLQRRYPAVRNGEEVYVLREHMTLRERRQMSARLRSEAKAKSQHADALDAETDALLQLGEIAEAA